VEVVTFNSVMLIRLIVIIYNVWFVVYELDFSQIDLWKEFVRCVRTMTLGATSVTNVVNSSTRLS